MSNAVLTAMAGAGTVTSSRRTGLIKDETLPEVGVAIEVRLLSVNDADETFQVALLIHTHYLDPGYVDAEPNAQAGFMRKNDYEGFIPTITMVNCVDTQFEDFRRTTRINLATGYVWTAFYNTCTLSEGLELEEFPFDRQLFRISFKSPNSILTSWKIDTGVLDFPPLPSEEAANDEDQARACFVVACELKNWQMNSFFVEQFPDDDDPASLTKGEFQVTIRAERDPRFYFFNFFLVIYLIVVTNICMISIDPQAAGERNAVSITLLLTLVAFKFVLNEGTPKVGYLTYMDKYVLCAFVFTIIALFENLFVSAQTQCNFKEDGLCDPDSEEFADFARKFAKLDLAFHLIFAGVWTLLNLVVALFCFIPWLIRETWAGVEDSQIGTTEKTLKRTRTLIDGNKKLEGKVRLIVVNGVEVIVPISARN